MEYQDDGGLSSAEDAEDVSLPDTAGMSDVDRIDRLIEYAENGISYVGNDVIGYVNSAVDQLNIAEGIIIKEVIDYITKGVNFITRKERVIEREFAPIKQMMESPDDTGIIPEIAPPPIDDNPIGNDIIDGNNCVAGTIRTDPVTCGVYLCNPDGTETLLSYDQKCLDDRNPPPPPPPPPRPPELLPYPCEYLLNTEYGSRYWDQNQYFESLEAAKYPSAAITLDPHVAMELATQKQYFDVTYGGKASPTPWTSDGVITYNCGTPIHTIVTIPYQSNSQDKMSVYDSQGVNSLTELWNVDSVVRSAIAYRDRKVWIDSEFFMLQNSKPGDTLDFDSLPLYPYGEVT